MPAAPKADDTNAPRLSAGRLRAFCIEAMQRAGVDAEQTRVVAENLVWNDLVGRRNHGVERLPIMLKRVKVGAIASHCAPRLTQLSETAALLNGDNGFGQFVAERAMRVAIDTARNHGTGLVGVRNSNFFGTGAYFAQLAAEDCMIALVLSNSFAKVAAHGGFRSVLGTNPFAFGAPRRNGLSLLIDMSTAGLAGSTVRAAHRAGEALPDGYLIDDEGQPVTDPARAGKATLLPAAGPKGYGLAMMVEILSAVLTGAAMSQEVGSLYRDFNRASGSGHFVLVLDIRRWMPLEVYFERLETLIGMVRASGEDGQVLLPGEIRWQTWDDSMSRGISLSDAPLEALHELADDLGLSVPWTT